MFVITEQIAVNISLCTVNTCLKVNKSPTIHVHIVLRTVSTEYTKLVRKMQLSISFNFKWRFTIASVKGNIHCYLFSYYKHYKLYCCVIIVLLVNEYWWICNFPNIFC